MTARPFDDLLVWWVLGIAIAVLVVAIILGRIFDRPASENELARTTAAPRFWLAVTFSNLNISTKLLIVLVGVAASSIGAFGIIEYREAKEALRRQAFNQLTAVREMKAQQVEDYFKTISNQIVTLSESRTIVQAARAFRDAFARLKVEAMADHGAEEEFDPELIAYYRDEFLARLRPNTLGELDGVEANNFIPKAPQARHLQELYLAENPNPTGEKHRLDDAGDGSTYSTVHRVYHPIIRSFLEKFDYYDIFLIDHETGEIVYSVFKEVDYGTSLLTGPYKDTNFARAFLAARDSAAGDFVKLEDFEPYYPSYNAPASFIASPIFDRDKMIGVLVFQMPVERINNIMTSHEAWKDVGLGKSGETYIVADDFLMRNQSRFLIEDRENYLSMIRSIGVPEETVRRIDAFNSSIGLQRVETRGTREALSGGVNTEIFPDYRGVPVLSSYRPLLVPGVRWAIMSEIDEAEAFGPVEALKNRMLLLMGLFLAVIVGISFVFSKTMTRPVKVLTAKAESLAKGDLGIDIDTSGGDEISHLARSFDVMRKALRELVEGLESKVAERTQSLQDSETRIRTIIEHAADGIIVIGEDGVVQSFSPAAERIFGYAADEVIRQKVDMLMPEPMRSEHDSYLRRYFESGEKRIVGRNREVVGLRKGGTEFPMELAVGEALLGKKHIFVGIVRDITERKAAEKALADQLALVEALVDTLPNPIFVKDPGGRYTILNKAWLDALGYEREDLIGKTVMDLEGFPIELRRKLQQEAEESLRTGGMVHKETIRRFADGKDHDLLYWETAFELSDGDIGGLVGVFVDITRQKELEREADAANRAKSTFLANMSHELRTPMNAIIGYSEMLAEDAEDEENEDALADLNKITAAGQHLLTLINDVLDVSKIEAGKMELYTEDFDVGDTLHDVTSMAMSLIEKKNNALATDYGENLGVMHSDLTKVRQNLFNLISNAAKFTENGTVTLSAHRETRDAKDWLVFKVKDTGIGIPEEKLDEIFGEFSQADESTSRHFGGTGLGLTLAQRFTEMMEGRIWAESVVGEGSSFIMELPATVQAEAEPKPVH
jgi:PAS domain S-box-containing protein